MDGLWSGVGQNEVLRQQDLTRHRLLRFNTSAIGFTSPEDASSHGSVDPNLLVAPAGGPHFIMSPEAPSGQPTLGFEFCFCDPAQLGMPGAERAVPVAAGFDVVLWVLISNTFSANGSAGVPIWASFQTLVGVQVNQLFRSFDIDASCIRFQIVPASIAIAGSLIIAFAEL